MRKLTVAGEEVAEISTRAPYKLHLYSRSLAMAHGKTVRGLYDDAVSLFLKEKPWKHGFKFRATQAPAKGDRNKTAKERGIVSAKSPTDWLQINMRLPFEVGQELDIVAAQHGVSLSAAAYSALFWYTWFVYPPKSEVERRERLKKQKGKG